MNAKSRWLRTLLWILIVLATIVILALAAALLIYPVEYVYRVLAWGESDAFDWQKFPAHDLDPAPVSFRFNESEDGRVSALFSQLASVDDFDTFLEDNQTQAFIIIQDGTVLYERYFNGIQRNTVVTSFSMAKSFVSALIGIAIDEGHIHSVDDPITDYLPELAQRDARFEQITIRDLLLMSSGLEYKEFRFPGLNGDDPLTTYHPDQRELALENTKIVDAPGVDFRYNKYHPQLLGMILERTTGVSVTEHLQAKIWDPLGMEFGGSWSTDSEASDFEKMETGVNARAIDFAKFGQLFLNNGTWDSQPVISEAWIAESTEPYLPEHYTTYYPEWFSQFPGQGYYTYMWWGMDLGDDTYDHGAAGDKGQFSYVSPRKGLVIVRHGIGFGLPFTDWFELFNHFANEF